MNPVDAMFETFNRSKNFFAVSIALSSILAVISVISTFNLSKSLLLAIAISSLIIQGAVFVLRLIGENKLELGEEIRRSIMLSDGLGITLSPSDWVRLAQKVGKTNFSQSPAGNQYYYSKAVPGPQRLLENLRESSFWTNCLAKTSSDILLCVFILIISTAVICTVAVAASIKDVAEINSFATAVIPFMAFWASSDFLNLKIKFDKLSLTADKVHQRCDELLNSSNISKEEALLLLSDYNCSMVSAPPIPEFVYNWKKGFLNDLWTKTQTP